MELDENYSVNVLDTATTAVDNDDEFDALTTTISGSNKKPLYQRAWRKMYKTITAPEKDSSGQRISLRQSISMRVSRDSSVSGSASSFFSGMYTPRSARHPTSRSDVALSETHTCPLPQSSRDASPIRGSRSSVPYAVEDAIPLSLPTGQAQQQTLDSARDLHPSPEAPALAAQVAPPPVPPFRKPADMSLSQLALRTGDSQDTVTPMTSARYGASDDTPAKDSEIPPHAPKISAASLVQGESSENPLHQGSAPGQAAMPKRQPEWPAGSDEPSSKKYEEADLRHKFRSTPSPSPKKYGKTGSESEVAGATHESTDDATKVPSKGGKKRGALRTFLKTAAVAAVGGAAFAFARGR